MGNDDDFFHTQGKAAKPKPHAGQPDRNPVQFCIGRAYALEAGRFLYGYKSIGASPVLVLGINQPLVNVKRHLDGQIEPAG